jgi:hypothetical protein
MAHKSGKRPAKKKVALATKPKKVKKAKVGKTAIISPPKPVVYAPLPNVIALTKKAGLLLWAHKRLLGGITLVYGLLSLLLVRGLGSGVNVAEIRDQFSNHAVGSVSAYLQLIGSTGGTSNAAAGVYQLILFIIVSLAVIWALRHVLAQQRVTTRDAYYKGMYPLIPYTLVLLVIGLQLLPVLIGLSVYQLVVISGVAASTIEVVLWGLLAFGTALISLYLLASSIIALYIVTLPNIAPMLALRTARKLVKARRWTVLRKMLFLPLIMLMGLGIILIPFILVAPMVAGWLLFVLGIVALIVGHVYFFTLYQELMNEQ